MISWDDYFARERAWIAMVMPPPTRVDAIKAAWESVAAEWDTLAIDNRLIVRHDLGVVPDVLFEMQRYGDQWVIEAEGVVVARGQVKTVEL